MTTKPYPHTIAVWAEIFTPDNVDAIMGADTLSGLPWPTNTDAARADIKHFREATRDHVLIMGSTTFGDLPAILRSRESTRERPIIVLTSRIHDLINQTRGTLAIQPFNPVGPTDAGALLHTLGNWPEYANRPVAVIGGPRVIELFEPYYDELFVTDRGYLEPGATKAIRTVAAPTDAFMSNFTVTETTELVPRTGNQRATVYRYTRRIPKEA